MALADVGVDLCGGQLGMTQKFLDRSQVGSAIQKVGSEGMAEKMSIDSLVELGKASVFDHYPLH